MKKQHVEKNEEFFQYVAHLTLPQRLEVIRGTLNMVRLKGYEHGVDVTDQSELWEWARTENGAAALVAFLHTVLNAVTRGIQMTEADMAALDNNLEKPAINLDLRQLQRN